MGSNRNEIFFQNECIADALQIGERSMQIRVKCLLVDDLEENLLALSALLRRDDVELFQARSGAEALELLLNHDMALAILDVQMPNMDGFELAELIRGSERTRHIPLIFVTAGARDQHRLFKGYDAGAVDFLYKPIEPHVLTSKADIFFQLYRQKQQLAHELRERSETLRLNEMFMAILGHDLRNPLQSIMLAAEGLQRFSNEAFVQSTATHLISSGKWMSRLVDDMLDLARARVGGGIIVKREESNIGALIAHVLREYKNSFPDRTVELFEQGDLCGNWDPNRLTQVASNLIGNALQHSEDSASVQIHIDGTNADAIIFTIANAGCIPTHILPHIFDPFRRGDLRKNDHPATNAPNNGHNGGLGLGLFIVQQVVLAHKGTVDVHSRDGRTSFRVVIPRHAANF
ncbi:MAG: Chemotaxis regulator - transmits chemoreceptor signals to flagelllar motor component CheY [Verrucomicrobiaceae bacterium]|nr:Chemotaxis regulator - transmits chemoreceptor signals to flagelllar motor component CheY [Verrucomicrobiaceae bacterium]